MNLQHFRTSNISLADLGLTLQRIHRRFELESGASTTVYDYFWLTSERLLLPAIAVDRIKDACAPSRVNRDNDLPSQCP